MAYELKNPDEETYTPDNTTGISESPIKKKEDFSDLEQPVFNMTSNDAALAASMDLTNQQKTSPIVKIAIAAVAVLILSILGTAIYNAFLKGPTDLTPYAQRSQSDLQTDLKIIFQDAPKEVSSIHQYSGGKVTVQGSDDLSVIYIDGRQVGLKIKNKKYSLFNVKIGAPEYEAVKNTSYVEDDSFSVLNDNGGASEAFFHYNKANNDCMVLYVNNASNRVVCILYFTDYALISKDLSGIDD